MTGACLQLDVGNSSTKWRLLAASEILVRGEFIADDVAGQNALLGCTAALDHIWISSVVAVEQERALAALLEQQWGVKPWFASTQARTAGLQNSYADASRMGVDRWLAMLGAKQQVTGGFCVIDAGSALTIDRVSAAGKHEGGYIIAGPALMERALLATDRVRFAEEVAYALSPGCSTAEAVRHGVALAQVGAVTLALEQTGAEGADIIYTGGAGQALMQLVGRGGTWLPDLVFDGLAVMAALR